MLVCKKPGMQFRKGKVMTKFVTSLSALWFVIVSVAVGQVYAESFLPPGKPVIEVGRVEVYRSLKYGGRLVDDQLVVRVDENGNAMLVAGEGSTDEISVYLAENSRLEFVASLINLREVASAQGGSPVRQADPASITIAGLSFDSSSLNLSCRWDEFARDWIYALDLWGHDIVTTMTPHLGRPKERRYVKLLLPSARIGQLLPLVQQAQEFKADRMKPSGE
jgi:hypothetical protein